LLLAQCLGTHGFEPCCQCIVAASAGEQRLGLLAKFLRVCAALFQLGALLARSLQRFPGVFVRFLQCAQVIVQLLEDIGRRLQPAALIDQLRNLGRHAGPIQFIEGGELFQAGQRIEVARKSVALLLNGTDLAANFTQPCFKLVALGRQCRDLGAVAPAQHIAAAVIDTVAVVFFVAAARVLDLAGAGDRARLAAELFLGGAAGHVETMDEFALQPIVLRRIGLDRQLAKQRIAVQFGQLYGFAWPHLEIHQASAQIGAIDPFGHRLVMRIGHQQCQAEAAQQAFGGAFPVAFIVAHLDQLTGEGQGINIQAQRRAHCRTNLDLLVIDVATAPLEAVDFGGLLLVFQFSLVQGHAVLGERVLQIGIAIARLRSPALIFATLRGEGGGIGCHRLAQHASQALVATGLGFTRIAHRFLLANLGGKALQSVAAVGMDGLLQLIHLLAVLLMRKVELLYLGIHALPFFCQQAQPLVDQAKLQASEVGPQTIPATAQTVEIGLQCTVAATVRGQGREHFNLRLGFQHCLMGAVEIVEVTDQGLQARAHLEGFEHMAAHEVGQVAHRFHRNRLVKQLQGLIVFDAEATAEPGCIGRKGVMNLGALRPQAFFQLVDVGAEVGKVCRNRQAALGTQKESRRLPLRFLHPEHLGECHRLVVAGIVEDTQDDRVAVRVA